MASGNVEQMLEWLGAADAPITRAPHNLVGLHDGLHSQARRVRAEAARVGEALEVHFAEPSRAEPG